MIRPPSELDGRPIARFFRRTIDRVVRRLVSVRPMRSIEDWEKRHEGKVREAVASILPHLPGDGFFLDIGCNIGSFSRHVRAARPEARGILFEPVPEYFRICEERFAEDEKIEVLNFGLGNENKETVIYKAAFNYGGNSVVPEIMLDRGPNSVIRADSKIDEELIRLRNVTSWLDERGIEDVDVIKMDTEGYDWAVMEGLHPWLVRTGKRPVLFIEVFTEKWHPLADRQRAAFESFYELGYGRVDIEELVSGICGDALLVPVELNPSPARTESGD